MTQVGKSAPVENVDRICHALTVDVEDYFQVSAFEHRISRADWDKHESRVVASTDRLLALFDRGDVQATFFVLGWVAERFPDLVKRIVRSGHEIASHGYWHRLVYELSPEQFADDIASSTDAIASACGVVPRAYRAPSFSIVERSRWALNVLSQAGYEIDSSIFPISGHDRYGIPGAKKEIHHIKTERGSICEFPPSIGRVSMAKVPIGGGYFRLFPTSLTSAAIRQIESEGRPAMFYIHPWEVDPDQPPIKGVGWKSRFRHYVGQRSTESKLEKLIRAHRFGTMSSSMKSVKVENQTPAMSSVQEPNVQVSTVTRSPLHPIATVGRTR